MNFREEFRMSNKKGLDLIILIVNLLGAVLTGIMVIAKYVDKTRRGTT